MRLLDLFCCQGGASLGYYRAGFEVTGVDISPMKNYPFRFIQANALELTPDFLAGFDAIAASPPCKVHTKMKAFSSKAHRDLVPETRAMLTATGLPYVIENVPGAPLIQPIMLCGSMFGLFVQRHRLFESNVKLEQPSCRHEEQAANSPGFKTMRYHTGFRVTHRATVVSVFGRGNGYGKGELELWREVMGMPWASKAGLAEAIPPAYTEFIGGQLFAYITEKKKENP